MKFRRAHGSILADFRIDLERQLTLLLVLPESERSEAIRAIVREGRQRTEQAEAYLHEGGFRFLSRFPLVTLLRLLPVVGQAVGVMSDLAGDLLREPDFRSKPFAHAGLAQATFRPAATYVAGSAGASTLADVMGTALE